MKATLFSASLQRDHLGTDRYVLCVQIVPWWGTRRDA
jgi:hypothetical protein